MNEFIRISESYYYTNFLILITSIICTTYCYKNRNHKKSIKYIYLYPLSSFIIQICSFFLFIFKSNYKVFFQAELTLEKIFLLIEYSSIAFFFYHELGKIIYKKLITIITLFYILYSMPFKTKKI